MQTLPPQRTLSRCRTLIQPLPILPPLHCCCFRHRCPIPPSCSCIRVLRSSGRRCHPCLTDVLDSGNEKLKKKHHKSALWPGLQQAVRCGSSAKEIEMSKDFRRHLRLTTAGFVPPEVLGVSITTVSFEASFPANVSFWEEGSFADASASDEGCEGSLSCRLFRMAASICSCSFLDVAAGALCVEWRVFFRANSIGKGLPGATGTRACVSIKTCELTSHTWAALLSFLGSCRRDSRSAF